MGISLGKINQVDLREIWKHEAIDFTKWLAEPENIEMLNEVVGLNIVDVETEKFVGNFKCDIVGRDEFSNKKIIIENQLEATNHDHLGKIITYASGLKASVIIWIVKEARPEHCSAIEWLNDHTDGDISFFLIELQLWKIGDSKPAPKFVVIGQPNDFEINIKKISSSKEATPGQLARLEFWENFNKVMQERKEFNIRKASTDHWYDFSIGTSSCHLSADLLNKEKKIRINLWIPPYNKNSKELYDKLYSYKEEIEDIIGFELIWDRLDGKKACRICTYVNGLNFDKKDNYDLLANEVIDVLVKFRKGFKNYIK